MDVELHHLKTVVNLPDSLVREIEGLTVPGALDRDKLISAMCAIRMVGLASRRFGVLSIGPQGEPLARAARLAADAFGYDATIDSYPSSVDLETLANHTAACLLISIPTTFYGRSELVLSLAGRLPPGGTVFLDSYTDATWATNVLPARALVEALEDAGFAPAQIEYYALLQKPLTPVTRPAPLTLREQERCLFVLGHARSGSSAVSIVVCEEPSCMMTFEANWYMPFNRRHPLDQFNLQRGVYGRRLTKTHFLPTTLPAAASVEDIFRWGLDRYHYFGDKIAVSVRENPWDQHPAKLALDYQMRVFPAGRYLLTFREPREAVLAQGKIKPSARAADLVNWWTTAAYSLMSILNLTDRAALLPFEWLRDGRLAPLERLTGRTFEHPTFQFRASAITTDQVQADAYWSKQPSAVVKLVDEAHDVYLRVLAQLDPETGRLARGSDQGDFEEVLIQFDAIAERANALARDKL